ncbi:MAG: glutathione S-transferase N-terminal domain-containing protein [Patescibacteria group bacterium]|nr:glutathione S-transferase N-terminal domain-containing protein [Patescibacteria group bacterium]
MSIKFYGATWCPDCRRSKAYLDDKKIPYDYINIDEVAGAAEEVEKINKGLQSIPTIVFPNGKILVEPSNQQLQIAIDENKDFLISHKNMK